jgi:proliferating cell nuclear antigen
MRLRYLMNLDAEHLGIPETDYAAVIKMPSAEFQRVIRDLSQFGDSLVNSVTKVDIQSKGLTSLLSLT